MEDAGPAEGPADPPRSGRRQLIGGLLTLGVLLAVFAGALPRIAEYGEVWAALQRLGAGQLGLLGALTVVALGAYAAIFAVLLPGVRLHTAFGVHMASTAVAFTVPAGGAVATGVTFSLYRRRGMRSEQVLAAIATAGLWELLARFALPVAAAGSLAITGEDRRWWGLAAVAVAMLLALLGGAAAAARSSRFARTLGAWLGRPVSWARARLGKSPVDGASAAEDLRLEVLRAVGGHWAAVSALTIGGHVAQAVLLLASLRVLGVPATQVGMATVLTAYALARSATAIPVTPGGVGVVDLGLVAILAVTAGEEQAAGIAAAVLVFRGLTYVAPILLGLVAWLVLRAPGWRSATPPSPGP